MLNKFFSLLKTIYFNLKYFPFGTAVKLPVYVSRYVYLKQLSGKIMIEGDLKRGMIEIGKKNVGIFDEKNSRTILEIRGTVIFKGNAFIGHGSKICVNESGVLTVGKNLTVAAESSIVCYSSVTFGDDCIISWENLIMDTDFHSIYDENKVKINDDKPIIIGNKVWIGCRCTLLRGTSLNDNTIIAPNSLISRSYNGENQIIGGVPAMILKKNVTWEK